MPGLSHRTQQMVVQREVNGLSHRTVGKAFGVTPQRIAIAVKEARQFLVELELELMKARKTGEVVGYAIPHGPDRQTALDYFNWCVRQLRERGVEVIVERRGTPNGDVMFLTDASDYGNPSRNDEKKADSH